MKKPLIALFMMICFTNANANRLLESNMADPDAILFGDHVFFAGTYPPGDKLEIRHFHKNALLSTAPLKDSDSKATEYDPLVKSGYTYRYCHVGGPDLAQLGNGQVILSFVARRLPYKEKQTCDDVVNGALPSSYYALSDTQGQFGAPMEIALNNPGVYSAPGTASEYTNNNHYVRLDPSVFVDKTDGNKIWFSYTWFTGSGNAHSTVNVNDTFIINNNVPANGVGINEAPEIFKNEETGYYYLLYSVNHFLAGYQAYFKKAYSIAGLDTSNVGCKLTFNSTITSHTDTGSNSGHTGVFKVGGKHYLIYHLGTRISDSGELKRDTYVHQLEFHPSGNIQQIPAPNVVGGGPHLGTTTGCS